MQFTEVSEIKMELPFSRARYWVSAVCHIVYDMKASNVWFSDGRHFGFVLYL